MDNNIDYSNTKIFENHTKQSDTKQGNAQLKELYEAFYKSICKKANEETAGFEAEKYNAIQLLTCFDSYLTADKKIMILGQEANTDEGNVFVPSPHYQTDEYYKYEYKIAHVGEPGIPKKKCRHTEYLKTRELICGFDKTAASVDREESILSVLSNNLNKTSLGGGHTDCYPPEKPKRKTKKYKQFKNRDDIIYSNFVWNGFDGNIYLHELNILRPTHLVFLSGPDYINHIIRDFGSDFYNKIKLMINGLSVDTPAVTGSDYDLSKEDIHNLFGINDYDSGIKILYAYHPFAFILNGEPRKKYNAIIEGFVNQESS